MSAQDANRRLAVALGWASIVDVGGALLGTPPAGAPECRGQAAVPDWCSDWRECGPLLRRFKMTLGSTGLDAIATCAGFDLYDPGVALFSDHDSEDDAMRRAIVDAASNMLEVA